MGWEGVVLVGDAVFWFVGELPGTKGERLTPA
jgi:hypothetical protein